MNFLGGSGQNKARLRVGAFCLLLAGLLGLLGIIWLAVAEMRTASVSGPLPWKIFPELTRGGYIFLFPLLGAGLLFRWSGSKAAYPSSDLGRTGVVFLGVLSLLGCVLPFIQVMVFGCLCEGIGPRLLVMTIALLGAIGVAILLGLGRGKSAAVS